MTSAFIRFTLTMAAVTLFGFLSGLRPAPVAAATGYPVTIELPYVCVNSFVRTSQGLTGHFTLVVANVGAVPAEGAVLASDYQADDSLSFSMIDKVSLEPGEQVKLSATFVGIIPTQEIGFVVAVDPDTDVPFNAAYGWSSDYTSPKHIPQC